jgi:hypothetical protein
MGFVLELPTAFLRDPRSRGVDQNPPHDPGAHSEKMRAVLPLQLADLRQAKIRLVHEGGRLKRVAGALLPHVVGSQPPELFVDERRQAVQGRTIAAAPRAKQRGDLRGF